MRITLNTEKEASDYIKKILKQPTVPEHDGGFHKPIVKSYGDPTILKTINKNGTKVYEYRWLNEPGNISHFIDENCNIVKL